MYKISLFIIANLIPSLVLAVDENVPFDPAPPNQSYILSDQELDTIYRDVERQIENGEEDSILLPRNYKKSTPSIYRLGLQAGVTVNEHTIQGAVEKSHGFYLEFNIKKASPSSVFLYLESSQLNLASDIPILNLTYYGLGSTIELFWTIKALVMLGVANVDYTDNMINKKISNVPPVTDFGLIWQQPKANPALLFRLIYRNYNTKEPITFTGKNYSFRNLSSISYSLSVDYSF